MHAAAVALAVSLAGPADRPRVFTLPPGTSVVTIDVPDGYRPPPGLVPSARVDVVWPGDGAAVVLPDLLVVAVHTHEGGLACLSFPVNRTQARVCKLLRGEKVEFVVRPRAK